MKCSKVHCSVISVQYNTIQRSSVQCSAMLFVHCLQILNYSIYRGALFIFDTLPIRELGLRKVQMCAVLRILFQCCVFFCSVVYSSAGLCILLKCFAFSEVLCISVRCCVFVCGVGCSCKVLCILLQCCHPSGSALNILCGAGMGIFGIFYCLPQGQKRPG